MLRALLVPVVFVYVCGAAWAQDPVHFADPKLKEAVEDELYVWDPTPADMLGLTELTYVEQEEAVTSLTGLEYAANLQRLNLRFNEIDDVSALSGLTNLRSIDLSRNRISDLSPLSGLHNLRYLNVHGNGISDLAPLAGLAGLETLILRFNEISDVAPLSGLTNLWELDLGCNQISDIGPLSSLRLLLSLCLWDNRIEDISALAGLTRLTSLELDSNQIIDISPLADLAILYDLDLADNLIGDISPLCGLMELTYLNLEDNPLTDEACDTQLPQILANNPTVYLLYDPPRGRTLSISSTPGGSVVDPGEGTFKYEQDSTRVRLEAKASPGFFFAGWSGVSSPTENPTYVTVDRDRRVEACFCSAQKVLHVDDNAAGDPEADGSKAHPFKRIQEAIDVAADGTTILVLAGTYRESIDLLGKDICLLGIDPNCEGAAGPCAVITGAGAEPAVRFARAESSECVLAGFVITKSQATTATILCDGASPSLVNCLIVGNRVTGADGATVYCRDSQTVLSNCTLADNLAGPQGAALLLVDSDVTVIDSILWGNAPCEILSTETSESSICYGDVQGGWPGAGNIEADPLFVRCGVWDSVDDPFDSQNQGADWTAGDYHLMSQAGRWDVIGRRWMRDEQTSPCVDAGLPGQPVESEATPNGSRINLGAYGGTAEASKSPASG